MTELKIDPELASLIPPLTEEERAGMEKSILEEGVREPIVTWHGVIVDGHNRYMIATEHGLDFDTVEYDFPDRASAIDWMVDTQCGRRNLQLFQRTALKIKAEKVKLANAAKDKERERKSTFPNSGKSNLPTFDTDKAIAESAGVSKDTVHRVGKILDSGDEKLIGQCERGDVSINAAYKKLRKEQQRAEREKRKSFDAPAEFPEDMCRLFAADIRDGLPEVGDGSVDAIICDPPYPKEYVGLYGSLAKVAARVLKPGGSLIAMAGQSYLPDVIDAMRGHGLEYQWCVAYLTPGGQAPHLFARNVNTFWKPVLWFVKGSYGGDCIGDVLKSDVNDNDKRFHHWGQSESGIDGIVERFTDPGHTVLDPFLGGGTTGVVSLAAGRRFIGSDIDAGAVAAAEERMRGAYGR